MQRVTKGAMTPLLDKGRDHTAQKLQRVQPQVTPDFIDRKHE